MTVQMSNLMSVQKSVQRLYILVKFDTNLTESVD